MGWQPRYLEDVEDEGVDDLAPAFGCIFACVLMLALWSLAVAVFLVIVL